MKAFTLIALFLFVGCGSDDSAQVIEAQATETTNKNTDTPPVYTNCNPDCNMKNDIITGPDGFSRIYKIEGDLILFSLGSILEKRYEYTDLELESIENNDDNFVYYVSFDLETGEKIEEIFPDDIVFSFQETDIEASDLVLSGR